MDRSESNSSITDEQKCIFKQFKENVSDIICVHYSDAILMKFLKAKNYDLRKAESNLRQADATKRILDVFNLEAYEKPEVACKYETYSFLGFAKDETLVRYCGVGKLDLIGGMKSACCQDLGTYFINIIEEDCAKLREKSLEIGREVNEYTYILDLEGCSIQQIAHTCVIEWGFDMLRLLQDYYPDIFRTILVINVPFYFDKIFSIFKPILKASITKKIQFFSEGSTAEALLKYIDKEVIPVCLGGSRVDSNGDPRCPEIIKRGGKIPEKYYVIESRASLLQPTNPDVTCVQIGPRCVYNHCFVAKEAGGRFRLKYRTENGNIHTTFLHREFGPDSEILDLPSNDEILDENDPKSRLRVIGTGVKAYSHITPTFVKCIIVFPGIHIFRFSNMHSWITSKKLFFISELLPPPDKDC